MTSKLLQRIWKDAVVALFKAVLGICLEGLRKITKTPVRTSGLQVEI
jgi:hypothetical protein